MKTFTKSRGFTLVEIVIVIGIMAFLTTIVYTSLSSSKAQNRDQQRVSDMSSIQLALEVYFNKHRTYPQKLWIEEGDPIGTDMLTYLVPESLPSKIVSPTSDPLGGYHYLPIGGSACASYHLWTTLETKISALDSKKGFDSSGLNTTSPCTTKVTNQYYHDVYVNASSSPLVYDVTPQ
ncbi:MAG: type II secretion system protein [Candidatus Paceibacterota bacterium]|jgi:prepilin-type N-terminal cleavage/methylation domain-containing protein